MEEYTLIAYLKGLLDEKASKEVDAWLALSNDNQKTLEDLYVLMFVDERIQAKNEIDVTQSFREFQEKNMRMPSSASSATRKMPLWRKVSTIAALLLVVLLSGAFISLMLLERNAEPIFVSTQLGERAQVTLPDGSKVWLNACSSVAYKKSFFSRKRSAELKGEAYFEIARNSYLPFVVTSDNSQIKVLGTKFNVRSNEDENYLSATLMEGSILFSENKANIYVQIKPGEELIFDKSTQAYQLKNLSNPTEILGWMEGRLIFENNSLEEIAKSLERNYNVRIRFGDNMVKQKRFNAEFEMADNIYQILSILELTDKFTYKINKREIVISSK